MGAILSSTIFVFGSSISSFLDAAGAFFDSLASIGLGNLLIALACFQLHLLMRTRAWFNVLRAAYPTERFQWRKIYGSYMAGIGINSIAPIHGGDVVKIYLAKKSVPNSNYFSVGSSFFVESIFDLTMGLFVLTFALSQGVLPSFIQLPDLSAFDLSFWASHPKFFLFMVTILFVLAMVAFVLLSSRAIDFWGRVKQGWSIMRDRKRYLRQVVLPQLIGWCLKLTAFYFFLAAFNVDATLRNALLVMSVQALSTLMPFTPNGAGAQQALLAFIFKGVAPQAVLLSYSVGQQLFIAASNALIGFTALYLMAKTLDWKVLRRRGEEEKAREKEGEEGEEDAHDWEEPGGR